MRTQVVIVGAGASGLQASQRLCEAGYKVLILEAKDRIGGRIYTSQRSFPTTNPRKSVLLAYDEGAAWVHGLGYEWPSNEEELEKAPPQSIPVENPMMELLEAAVGGRKQLLTQELIPVAKRGNPWMRPRHCCWEDGQLAIYFNGSLVQDAVVDRSLRRHEEIMDQVDRFARKLMVKGGKAKLQHQSFQQALDSIPKKPSPQGDDELVEHLRRLFVYMIEAWYAGPTRELQLSEFFDDEDEDDNDDHAGDETYTEQGDFFGAHATLKSGMSKILQPLVNHGEKILTQQPVVSIVNERNGVLVKTEPGLTISADACICTVPLACLKDPETSVQFDPPLSKGKLNAIQTLRVGNYKKVLLTFESVFWPREPAFLAFVVPDMQGSLGTTLFADNLWAKHDIPCLEVVLVADTAQWAMDKATEEIRDALLDYIRRATGVVDVPCVDCHVTKWEEDRYSRAAYSNFGVGYVKGHTAALRIPEWQGKLVLAGEHTIADFEGSVHAALYSGRNAAKSIQDYLTD
jgi:monoamine oxidase